MILNSDELIGFVHLPSSAVRSSIFERQSTKTKAAPMIARHGNGLLLGNNDHAGQTVEVRLSPEQRTRHCHIIGASGTGKSTLLFNLIRQDIENGAGIAVLDPHGDLIDRILGIIPQSRIDDVVLVDPSDSEYSVGFNILSAHSDLEKNLLASDLVAVFQRLSTSWGDQMNSVLKNAILAFLESDRRGTLADLQQFLIEKEFRNDFLKSVRDTYVVNYWHKSFPLLSGTKSIGSILTRLDTFLAQKPIRYMVSQPENRLDFAHIMDSSKIFLAKLPEGLLGRENSHLLGSLLVSKFQQRDYWCD
jgi:GTPase SAR1 family protein